MLRETNDTVLIAHAVCQHARVRRRRGAFAWVTPTVYDLTFLSGFGVGLDRRAVLRQPLAQARARERRRAVSVHDDPVGDRCSAASCSAKCPTASCSWARHHRRGRALHLPARAACARRPLRATGPHDRTTAFRARRHRPDGARHLPVLLQRRARQMAARHLFGVADAGDPQRRRDRCCCTVSLARGQGGVRRRAAAGTAAAARCRCRSPNSIMFFVARELPAARRHRDVLPGARRST